MQRPDGDADTSEEFMTGSSEAKLAGIREQVARGDYQVDPKAVADAIVRRLCDGSALSGSRAVRLRSGARTRPARPRPRGS